MEKIYTKKRRLNFGQTIVICGVAYLLYRIFKSPELDRLINKVVEKQ